eukprot:4576267-Amphidinium_carterae.1
MPCADIVLNFCAASLLGVVARQELACAQLCSVPEICVQATLQMREWKGSDLPVYLPEEILPLHALVSVLASA